MENFGENILIKSNLELADVGVVIPTYNEADFLADLLSDLKEIGFSKVCVVDVGSTDETISIAESYGITVVQSKVKNKAYQLNIGADNLPTAFYLFIHADVRLMDLKASFFSDCINSPDFTFGNFKLSFDNSHWFLRINAKFSYFRFGAFQFGDQGLLVRREAFERIKGYNEELLFMEGNDIVRRLRKQFSFSKLDAKLMVSARKYEEVGVFRLQFTYCLIYLLARAGINQNRIANFFKSVFTER